MTSTATPLRYAGALLILAVGAIHAFQAPEYLDEQAYIGVLFILAAIGSLVVAVALVRANDPRAWGLGALISIGCFVGFVLSRTTGLPGFKEAEWEGSGVLSMIVEAAFVVVAIAARSAVSRTASRRTASGSYA